MLQHCFPAQLQPLMLRLQNLVEVSMTVILLAMRGLGLLARAGRADARDMGLSLRGLASYAHATRSLARSTLGEHTSNADQDAGRGSASQGSAANYRLQLVHCKPWASE